MAPKGKRPTTTPSPPKKRVTRGAAAAAAAGKKKSPASGKKSPAAAKGGFSDDNKSWLKPKKKREREPEPESEDDEDDEEDDEDDADVPAGDDSDDGEEEAALIKAMRAQQRRLDARGATRRTADDDDLDASASDSDDEAAGIRGSKKDDFYGDDDVDHEGQSDEEERADEEREARRLQRAAADGMDAGDFDAFSDESDEDDDASDSERETLGAKARALANQGAEKKKEKKGKKSAKNEGAAVESLGRDAVAAAASDAVASDAPELIALTKELTKTLDEITQSVEPVIAAARAGELATAEGISYLDAKHLLMLSYCINIVFYLLLKSEGRSVRDHPVVLRLVEIRAYLEKLRPIDKKLKYQIDKLLKMADGPRNEKGLGEGEDEDEDDPLRFKPNPDALVGKTDEEEGVNAGGAYRPPKMVPTAMDDFEEGGKSAKQKRKEKEARRRASRSALIKELAQELGEAPEELGGDVGDTSSAFAKREFARMEARAKIEEDLFTRVPLSKTERRRAKATTRSMNSLANVGDFGDDVADLVEVAEELEGQRGKRQRLVDSVTLASGSEARKNQKPVSGEQDVPLRDSLGDRRNKYERGVNKKLAERAAEENGMYDDEPRRHVEEDEEYVAAAAARDARRAAKEEKYRRSAGIVAAMEEEMDADEKRDVGGKIMANRGLTPHRNKDHKNPRKRLRGKFEKAVVRRKGQVRSMREDQGGYGGEASGIKTSVTKSRKFGA
uniref:Sas10 C-terminal domain-containing protein n=1 Tax=Micromonas pusilla TaxID=38833 RepID=A0A7S0GNB6_MICPS